LRKKDNILKIFKENLSVILISIYLISFTNFFIFYKSFNIPIFSYININDFLFYTLEYVFLVFSTIIVVNSVLLIVYTILFILYEKTTLLIRKKYFYYKNNKHIKYLFNKKFKEYYPNFVMTILFVGIFLIGFLPSKSITLPAFFIYIMYILNKYDNDQKMINFFIAFVYVIIFISTFISNLFDTIDKRIHKDDSNLMIVYENSFYLTNKESGCINYLGETSTNIFLYDIENKKSIILFKDKVESININNENYIFKLIDYIQKNESIREFYKVYFDKSNL